LMLAYLHIPKTGGSSFGKVLKQEYADRFWSLPIIFKEPERTIAELRRVGALDGHARPLAISGHFVFGLRELLPADVLYATILREPIDRFISHYWHLMKDVAEGRPHHGRAPVGPEPSWQGILPPGALLKEMTLDEYLSDPRYFIDNLQTRMLVCRSSPFEELPPDALERAKDHLRDRFSFVGVTERMDEFLAVLAAAHGFQLRFMPRVRVNHLRPTDSLAGAARRRAEAHNQLDLELYAFGKTLFDRAVEQAGPETTLQLDVLRRAKEIREGRAVASPAPDDLRARLVAAYAQVLLQRVKIDKLEHALGKARAQLPQPRSRPRSDPDRSSLPSPPRR
jgi:hypothetical protein